MYVFNVYMPATLLSPTVLVTFKKNIIILFLINCYSDILSRRTFSIKFKDISKSFLSCS